MSAPVVTQPSSRIAARPLPLSDVEVSGFLGEWTGRNSRESLLAGLQSVLRERFEKLSRGEDPGPEKKLASNSDLFKWMEGCACTLMVDPGNTRVREELERTVDMVVAVQREDGFLTSRTGEEAMPFTLRDHDLYSCGHYLEAAVAHFGATGSRKMLESACRYADFYIRKWQEGHEYYATVGEREHAEIEIALVRLYRATGEKRFLDFAGAVTDMATLGERVADLHIGGGRTHCVRVGYYLAACAEIYAETGEEKYRAPLESLWREITDTLTYVTGGVGTGERFPHVPFVLPQRGNIAETCASIAMIMWGRRMHQLGGEAHYFDAIETALYNNVLGALSLDSRAIYYYQPLATPESGGGCNWPAGSRARVRLPELHRTSCCFPNVWRLLPALGEYVFSLTDSGLCVNLYSASRACFESPAGVGVQLAVDTEYPRGGSVRLAVDPESPAEFELRLRIPAWTSGARATVNGEATGEPVAGEYLAVKREWRSGDRVELELPMRAEAVRSRPEMVDSAGQTAFRRGPLVYCLEGVDSGEADLDRVALVSESVEEAWAPELLGGVHVLVAEVAEAPFPEVPYPAAGQVTAGEARRVRLVPFYARGNRSDNPAWRVWLPRG